MGLFDFFRKNPVPSIDLSRLSLDLGTFICGHTPLGQTPDLQDVFATPLQTSDICRAPDDGVEINTKDGILDGVCLELASFRGSLARHGESLPLDTSTRVGEITAIFGEPYWIDSDDNESILFYEYAGGTIELQFEFPNKETLGIITLIRHGVLSDEEQRRHYGVTKSWPPAESSQVAISAET